LQTNATKCLFPQYFADEIETQLFPLQSLYDPLQAPMSKIDPNLHGKWLLDTINRTILQTKRPDGRQNGGYLYSCSRHCGGELIQIDGYTAPTALETFLADAFGHDSDNDAVKSSNSSSSSSSVGKVAGAGHSALYLQYQQYPCITCCNDV